MLKSLFALVGLASIASMVACGSAASEDVGFTGSSEGALLAGTRLTESQVATYVRAAGFPESEVGTMVCIAKYESNYYEKASHQNSNGTTDYGLFQINSVNLGSGKCASNGTQAYDPTTNAKCARDIYEEQGVNAWYAYQSHKSECASFKAPAPTGTTTTSSSGSSSTGSSGSTTTTTTGSSGSSGSATGSSSGSGTTTGTTTVAPASGDDDSTGDDDSSSTGSSSGSTTTTTGSGSSSTGSSSGSTGSTVGECWSQTLGEYVAPDACVNSAFDNADEQCINGSWYSGVSNGVGPDGACTSQD